MPEPEPVDLTTQESGEQPPPVGQTVAVAPYDPQKHGDETRRKIAIFLLWILAGVLAAGFVTMGVSLVVTKCNKECAERTADLLMKLLGLVFTPVVALVGSAIGFYFGAHPTHAPAMPPESPSATRPSADIRPGYWWEK